MFNLAYVGRNLMRSYLESNSLAPERPMVGVFFKGFYIAISCPDVKSRGQLQAV